MILDDFISVMDMRAIELNANYLGVPNLILMENAGKTVADIITSKSKKTDLITFFCGLGGNGGDGLVAARHLASRGYKIKIIIIGDPTLIRSEETQLNYSIINQMKSSLNVEIVKDSSELKEYSSEIIVDALLGYNFKGPLNNLLKACVNKINESNCYKIAIDVPTGIYADTGETFEEYIKADLIISFHKPKLGFKEKPKNFGEIKIVPIGIPPETEIFTGPGDILKNHKTRLPDNHKGMFGKLLVIGGNSMYSGAPTLTTLGAYKIGLDLVYTALPEKIANTVSGFSPSIITLKYPQDHLTEKSLELIEPFIEKVDSVVIGPGIGLNTETKKAVNNLISICEKRKLPTLLDADALKIFSEQKRILNCPTVFTPNTMEFKILTGIDTNLSLKNKAKIVEEEAEKLNAVILLKGNTDVISDGFKTRYNQTGNPGMTVGGTGDVLSGIVSGYLAQKVTPFEAACSGAFINGVAGDIVFNEKGYHILPEDLIIKIPEVIEKSIKGKLKKIIN
ncbi:NAD(P)H-hydrate dehydratase [Candidatus Bathyarchaeota archaeon]|nr:NAD(P)H-hydrate dehydratase [Candidatus Bathyarchaeota archaeon]